MTEVKYLGVPLSSEGSEGLGSPAWGAVGRGDRRLWGEDETDNEGLSG